MNARALDDAASRGYYDAARSRPALFRNRGGVFVPTVDDPQADEWTDEMRRAYVIAYDEAT